MPVVLPFQPSLSPYSFDVVLAGRIYTLDVRWNTRDAAWYFDIGEASDQTQEIHPIVLGVKVVLGMYLGRRSVHELFRDGVMLCRVPQGDDNSEPRYDDMGTRVQVWYYTREEQVQELLASVK